jgi:hypothetical protein
VYFQQGDCLLKKTKFPADGLTVVPGNILFKGQQHHHRVRGDFEMYDASGVRYLRVAGKTELFHEEHKTVFLPKGDYRLDFVQEYDHFLEESRQVID